MSNILDKPLESVFGYISVLPGAFSAYRYKALQNTSPGKGPLASYFKGESMHGSGAANVFDANMYLAEDRILCFELIAKKYESWKLKYVKSAKAETDVPDNVPEFISQRRRWLNGSFFAAFYSVANFTRIWTSGQPFYRMLMLQLEFMYNAVQLLFNWFALGNFFLAFFFLAQSTTLNRETDPFRGFGSELFDIVNPPIDFKNFSSIQNALKKAAFRDIVISIVSTYGLYFITSFIHGEPWHMFTCLLQYILLVPFYVNILMVYAFCNTHDVSWGTKGDNGSAGNLNSAQAVTGKDGKKVFKVEVPTEREDINGAYDKITHELKVKVHKEKEHRDVATKKDDYYKLFRTNLVIAWIFTNGFLILLFTSNTWQRYAKSFSPDSAYNPYLTFVFWSFTGISAIRAFGSVWYLVLRAVFG
ncbi:1478_t:CDS:2 [Gigaspora rosea]|nr:1478_t:CDS:2 [Gigaspora rosea]